MGRTTGALASMWIAVLAWLCSLPLVSWLLVPRLGPGPAAAVAFGLLVLVGWLCWGLCTRQDALASVASGGTNRAPRGRRQDANAEGRFTHLRARNEAGVAFYSALGLGQVHYFCRSGPTIVWLTANAEVARPALADTVRVIR